MADELCLKMPDFHVTFRDLLHAVNLRHGTDGFISPPKEGVLRIFSPWKIQRPRSGLNPRAWVPKASITLRVTLGTTGFNMHSTFCPRCAFLFCTVCSKISDYFPADYYFMYIWTQRESVYCSLRTESFNILEVNLSSCEFMALINVLRLQTARLELQIITNL